MRDGRNGNRSLLVTVATVVVGLATLAALATAAPASAVAPAADIATLAVVPPEPAPAPVVAPTRLFDAQVIVVSTPDAAPTPIPDAANTAAAAPTNAPGRTAGTVDIGEADTVERDAEEDPVTATLKISVPATDAADRTVTVRSTDGTVLAGPFRADGTPVVVEDLVAGDVDLYVEDLWHGGGSTLARTPTTLVGGRTHVARCDGRSLECTVS